MNKATILFLALGVVFSSLLAADEFENKLSSAMEYYKNGKTVDASNELSDAIMFLQNKKEFKIKNLFLCDSITGYEDYKKSTSNKMKAGKELQIYIEVEGYAVEKISGKYGFWISKEMVLFDQTGKEVLRKADIREYRKYNDFPVIPFYMQNTIGNIPVGKYKLEITVKDHIKKSFTTATLEFEVEQ